MVYLDMHRRQYLLAASTTAIPLIAGCSDTEGDGGDGGSGDGNSNEDGESTNSGSENSSESEDGGGSDGGSGEDKAANAPEGENVLENRGLKVLEHELVVEEEHSVESVTVEGIVENTTDEAKGYAEVSVRVYDADGHQLENYRTNTTDLQAGGTWKFEVMINEDSSDIEEYDIRVSDSPL